MRGEIIRLLLQHLIHNSGKLPAQVIVNPVWVSAVRAYLLRMGLDIKVGADASLDIGVVRLEA